MKKYSPDKNFAVMTRDEVRRFDSWAINTLGVPGVVLMENAGRNCTELIKKQLAEAKHAKVCIFCGTGNNGGDGYVIARHLLNSDVTVTVVVCGDRGRIRGDAKINLDILERLGQPIESLDVNGPDIAAEVGRFATGADMIADGLFGTGLRGQLSEQYKKLIESINAQDCPILAIDIPSGLDCDSGEPLGAAIRATFTVTFAAVKTGFVTAGSAVQYTGEIYVASIGVEPNV